MDDRAQAHGILVFFVMVITGALLFTLFQPAVDTLTELLLAQASHQEAKDAIHLRATIFGYILVYVIFVAGLFVIARSVLQSRSPG